MATHLNLAPRCGSEVEGDQPLPAAPDQVRDAPLAWSSVLRGACLAWLQGFGLGPAAQLDSLKIALLQRPIPPDSAKVAKVARPSTGSG